MGSSISSYHQNNQHRNSSRIAAELVQAAICSFKNSCAIILQVCSKNLIEELIKKKKKQESRQAYKYKFDTKHF